MLFFPPSLDTIVCSLWIQPKTSKNLLKRTWMLAISTERKQMATTKATFLASSIYLSIVIERCWRLLKSVTSFHSRPQNGPPCVYLFTQWMTNLIHTHKYKSNFWVSSGNKKPNDKKRMKRHGKWRVRNVKCCTSNTHTHAHRGRARERNRFQLNFEYIVRWCGADSPRQLIFWSMNLVNWFLVQNIMKISNSNRENNDY